MPKFEYKGVDGEGQAIAGSMVCGDLGAAALELQNRGFVIENLTAAVGEEAPPVVETEAPAAAVPRYSPPPRETFKTFFYGPLDRVPLTDLSVFFRQFAAMLHAGVGMVGTLDTLAKQCRDAKLRQVIIEARTACLEGMPLSRTLERYPDVFSPLMISLVRTGERGGMLEETLKHVSEYIDREIKLRNIIRVATLYPKVVVTASILIITFANFIIRMVGGSGEIYSPLTQLGTWACLAPWIIGIFVFIRYVLPQEHAKEKWDQFWLSTPYFGVTIRQFALAKFSRAMAALYRGGVGPPEAAGLAAQACGNLHMRRHLAPAEDLLKQGHSLTEVYTKSGVMDHVTLSMIHTGETSGNLDDLLERIAVFYEEDSEVRSRVMATVIGVMALIGVGIYVGYVIITFYMTRLSSIGAAAEG